MRKRRRYVTVIVNGDTGRAPAMAGHRHSAALTALSTPQPHRRRRGAVVVAADGSRAYKTSIRSCSPHARHVLDRLCVIRWLTAGPGAARRDIQRREPHGTKPAFDPEVSRARFSLMRRGDQRLSIQFAPEARLWNLLRASPRFGRVRRN